jgi:zinc protease
MNLLEPIPTITLSNGLQVKLKEIHTAPLVSNWIWYRVGSRDEVPGQTGISHWVEHLQFKGTKRFPADDLEKAVSRTGGVWNAFTYLDWTTYFETMPSDKIDLALDLEADRMLNSIFDSKEVESERTVVISERQGRENSPGFRLGEAVKKAAFQNHAYRHEIIGDLEDLMSLSRDDLYHHYQTYYTPNNALIAIAGDFELDSMLKRITDLYGKLPVNQEPLRMENPEPPQQKEQRVAVDGPGETILGDVVYHTPPANHPDFFALLILDSILTGPQGLNMFGGGGISNKTSRLYKKMVEETEAVVTIQGGLPATIDPYVYSISFIIHPGSKSEIALQILDDEIKRAQDSPPENGEIHRAAKQTRALFAYGGESITNQAFWLGFSEMFASYDWVTGYLDNLEAVTPKDVQRVAQTYLLSQNRVVGFYYPNNRGDGKA